MAETGLPNNTQPEADDGEIITVAMSPGAWVRITILIGCALSITFFLVYLLAGSFRDVVERRVVLRTFLADATGITKKDKVEVDGIPIGRVRSVTLSGSNEPSRVVQVEISILTRYLQAIPVDSKVEVTADNLLGDKYINIHKGVARESVKPGDELLVQPPDSNFDAADLIVTMEGVLAKANKTLDQIEDPNSPVGQVVIGEEYYDKFRTSLIGIQRSIHSYSNPKSLAGQALFGTELYDQLRNPILDFDKQLVDIQNGQGQVGHLLETTEQYDQLRDKIAAFHQSVLDLRRNGYLTSQEDYDRLLVSLKDITRMIDSFTASPAFTQAQPYESLNGQAAQAAKVLEDFRKNPQKYLRIKVR
jgi:phospholipid/cholesterol/gamma-HCH transport system substrate-binding protein